MPAGKKRKTNNANAGLKQVPLGTKAKHLETKAKPVETTTITTTAAPSIITAATTAAPFTSTALVKESRKRFFETLTAFIVFAIVFAIVFYFLTIQPEESFKFQALQQGILFVSNIEEPAVFLVKLRLQDSFQISPAFFETAASNTFASNALVLFNTILISKQKQSISLLREVQNNELLYCRTNRGNAKTDERIEMQECIAVMNDKSKVLILIELPNAELEQTKVILEPNRIEIMPKKNSDITLASYLILKTMYSDSDETIQQINNFLKQINQ